MKPFYKLFIKPILSIITTPFFVFVENEFNSLNKLRFNGIMTLFSSLSYKL